ncbi:Hypothetical protein FKW44_021370 [Caligus rogercresseyi]|uniref:Uncharacterized protein n=1 Tax=Caligus rogercresseyi TaxID=217165 RepID=A0A7T8GRN3_CALRO|nr:Hypothetical protein FKW44_021370 [Caligus rogercresseyi]
MIVSGILDGNKLKDIHVKVEISSYRLQSLKLYEDTAAMTRIEAVIEALRKDAEDHSRVEPTSWQDAQHQ